MQEFIKCLQSYLKGKKLNKIEDDKDLVILAVEQSLQTILYPVYNDKSYKKYYIGWVVKQEEFLSIQEEITNIFNPNNINHLFTKGSVLCKYYDDPSIRTRGDIDVFVSFDDMDKARLVLSQNGYVADDVTRHDVPFYKNGILIELHFTLFDEQVEKSWNKYFENPFLNSKLVSNNLYKLDDTYHLLYCIAHFTKHLRYGAGIRYILDFYYMLKKTNIDYDKLHKDLELLGLSKLYNNILNAIYYLTEEKLDDFKYEDVEYFILYMLENGIHGHENKNIQHEPIRIENKFTFIINRLFLTNKQYRKTMYPKFGRHWYLYIICLIVHWFRLITSGFLHKTKTLFKIVFGKNKKKDLYKKLGI